MADDARSSCIPKSMTSMTRLSAIVAIHCCPFVRLFIGPPYLSFLCWHNNYVAVSADIVRSTTRELCLTLDSPVSEPASTHCMTA